MPSWQAPTIIRLGETWLSLLLDNPGQIVIITEERMAPFVFQKLRRVHLFDGAGEPKLGLG